MVLSRLSQLYQRFEKYISVVGLIYGFIFTSLTLTRIDAFWENFWIVLHLIIAVSGIIALTFLEKRKSLKSENTSEAKNQNVSLHFYLILIVQFAFGGLFSTFFVFYLRSSSFYESWLFILILLVLLVGNEIWKKYYTRLVFQITILFVALYLFLIFLLPTLAHRLGSDLFVTAGILALVLSAGFLSLLRRISPGIFKTDHNLVAVSITGIFIIMNVLYFTGVLPPIPLSIKDSGVYHKVEKTADGNYKVLAEEPRWQDYFTRYPVFNRQTGESVYVFSAVFSPVDFSTKVVHQWQYYDEEKQQWVDSSRIVVPIIGGREDGFRIYSVKPAVPNGLWRVKVLTERNQAIGYVTFEVKNTKEPVSLIELKK